MLEFPIKINYENVESVEVDCYCNISTSNIILFNHAECPIVVVIAKLASNQ